MLRIKEICKSKGLELKQFAQMYGTTYQTLFSIINGNPTIDTLKKIADLLEVPITELFTEKTSGQITCPHCKKEIKVNCF